MPERVRKEKQIPYTLRLRKLYHPVEPNRMQALRMSRFQPPQVQHLVPGREWPGKFYQDLQSHLHIPALRQSQRQHPGDFLPCQ